MFAGCDLWSVSSELNWNIFSQFCSSQDFKLPAADKEHHTCTLLYLPANSMKNDCSTSAVSLGLSSDASPAWGSRCPQFITRQSVPVVAWQQWAFPHQLFCCVKEQIRRGSELEVCCLSSRGKVGEALALIQVGKNALMPFYRLLFFTMFFLDFMSVIYCTMYIHSCSVDLLYSCSPFRMICHELLVILTEL